MFYNNPLLNEEINSIISNDLPQHTSSVEAIIHTEDADHYIKDVIGVDILSDYDAALTDDITLSCMMGTGDSHALIYPYRDNLQITIKLNFNGKIIEVRYKAFLISNTNNMLTPMNSSIDNVEKNKYSIDEVKFKCVNMLYGLLRLKTVNGVMSNVRLDTIIRYYFNKELKNITIDGKPILPILDIDEINNDRLYSNIVIRDGISLLDLPTELQTEYGIYNGGIGTYIYNNGDVNIISIYPSFNSEIFDIDRLKLVVYIVDIPTVDMVEKTCVIVNNELRVLLTSNVSYESTGEDVLYNGGVSFKAVNANNVMDRVYDKQDGVVTSNANNVIDSQAIAKSKDGLSIPKHVGVTDNLYMVRSSFIRASSKILKAQWNYSRPDLLYPNMPVEVVHSNNNTIIREDGTLLSTYSNISNSQRVTSSLLNIIINRKD